MPAGIHPIAPATPKHTSIALASANTNRDGTTGTYTTLLTAGANGALVTAVRARSALAVTVAPTTQVLRLWHQLAGAGNRFLIDEVVLSNTAATSAIAGVTATFNLTNIVLGAGDVLAVTQHVAEAVHYTADHGDY